MVRVQGSQGLGKHQGSGPPYKKGPKQLSLALAAGVASAAGWLLAFLGLTWAHLFFHRYTDRSKMQKVLGRGRVGRLVAGVEVAETCDQNS